MESSSTSTPAGFDWPQIAFNVVLLLSTLYLVSRLVFLIGGGLMMDPDSQGCVSVNLFAPLVYEDVPCPENQSR